MQTLYLGGAVALWAGIHSWLASSKMKGLAAQWLGPMHQRTYRLAYNVFSVVSFAPIALLLRSLPDRLLYRVDLPWAAVMVGVQVLAIILLAAALLQTDVLHFAGITQLLGRPERQGLVTRGFYRWVRHPLYLFGLLIMWLTPLMTVNQLTVYAVLTIYLYAGGTLEEMRLLREFGREYDAYRARTPMLIPGIRTSRNDKARPAAEHDEPSRAA